MDRRQLISIFFIVLLVYSLGNVIYILSPFTVPIFWAAMLAFGFYPLYERCVRITGQRRMLAAGLTTALIFLTFVPALIVIFIMGVREAMRFYEWLTLMFQNGEAELALSRLWELPFVQKVMGNRFSWENVKGHWQEWVLSSVGNVGGFLLSHATLLTKNVAQGLLNFGLTFFLVFFFLWDGADIYRFVYEITPLDEDNKREIFGQLSDTFSATLRGQLVTALAQATMAGVIFLLLGLPLPIFFAALTFFAAMIPVFGAATVWGPFAVYFLLTHDYGRAGLLLVLGVVGISGIDNVLKPLLIGQKTRLPYSLLFLGILGGLQVYGFMGIFLAPALLSLFFVLIKIYRQKFESAS
jgi:predicted PurR-regulated permease PerM